MTTVFSGRKSAASFASREPAGSWARTSEGSLASLMGESSVPFSETWPTWGTALDGLATALTKPVERPTGGTGCSSSDTWWTPRASDENGAAEGEEERRNQIRSQAQTWPTPKSQNMNEPGEHGQGGKDLQTEGTNWPTPDTSDRDGAVRRATDNLDQGGMHSVSLHHAISSFPQAPATSKPGTDYCSLIRSLLLRSPGKRRLNWTFVLRLQDFPTHWLD